MDLSDDRSGRVDETEAGIRAFLIADVRGYTRFTQERGDEAAAELAGKFARISRAGVEAKGGTVVELRGDEALAVFASSRQAIRAAVELQAAFAAETAADPSLPLGVGIGLDAGEAVPVEGGFRGGALNLAARLCGQAGPGEVLASREAVHMARKVEGVRYEDRGSVHLKGIADPVDLVRIASEEADPAAFFATLTPVRQPSARRPALRSRALIVGLVLALAVGASAWFLVDRGGGTASFPTGPNTVAVIDAASGEVVDGVALGAGAQPGALASGFGSVWVANFGSQTIAEIDPTTRAQKTTFSAQGLPSSVAAGKGYVWIATALSDKVRVFDPALGAIVDTVPVPNATDVTVGFGYVWVTDSSGDSLYRIDPDSLESIRIPMGEQGRDQEPTGVAVGEGGVWVANSLARTVTHVDPQTGAVLTASIAVGCAPEQVAVGAGYVWATCRRENLVVKIDPTSDTLSETIDVAAGPTGIVATAAVAWVTCGVAGVVQQIDPRSGEVVNTIRLDGSPQAPIVVGGQVWVAVSQAG